MNDTIAGVLATLPERPGVYLMKDASGAVIYVGKAKNLRSRVRSYFQSPHDLDAKTRALVSNIQNIEYIITGAENEAFILENSLIKKHRPRYNVMFRDDKTYPFIRLAAKDEYPFLSLARRVEKDGAEYFGPYADQWSVRIIIRLVQDAFAIRSCESSLKNPKKRPCLHYFIGRCKAPCTRNIQKEEYDALVKAARNFLRGDFESVLPPLEARMRELSAGFKFEQAAKVRDQIASVRNIAKRQSVVCPDLRDRDIIAEARGTVLSVIEMFNIRKGVLLGHKTFPIDIENCPDDSVIDEFLPRYYQESEEAPGEIIASPQPDPGTAEFIISHIAQKFERKVRVLGPRDTDQGELLATVHKNALNSLKIKETEKVEKARKSRLALREIAAALGLPAPPSRIECFDISNISGTLAVGSMSVAVEGAAAPSEYRKFRIKTVTGIDDYRMMKEVLTRRFRRAIDEGQALPDLVMIDGGQGHLSAACEAVSALGLSGRIRLCSIAKQNEDIFVPASPAPAPLHKKSQGQYLLMRVRDEAHRFAISYHKKLRKGRMTLSILSEIKGLGKARISSLYEHFETIDRIRAASVEELRLAAGITAPVAKKIFEFFHGPAPADGDGS